MKKGTHVDLDAYSAFFDNDKLNETELQNLLKSNGIERTFICGVATDICVKHTVFDSLEIGFEVKYCVYIMQWHICCKLQDRCKFGKQISHSKFRLLS